MKRGEKVDSGNLTIAPRAALTGGNSRISIFEGCRRCRASQKGSLTVNLQNTHIRLRNFSHPGQREGELKGEKNKANT